MAYNTRKGNQHSGDIQFEGDPNETQIDFENDSITLKTGGKARLVVNNNHVSSSTNLSGSKLYADTLTVTTIIGGSPVSISGSSIEFSGSVFFSGSSSVSGSHATFTTMTGSVSGSSATFTTISGSSATITSLSASFISGASPIEIAGDSIIFKTSGVNRATIAGPKLSVVGQMSASLGVTGSTVVTAGGILRLYNDSGNPKIESTFNHLVLRNTQNNKDIRVQLGENAGATQFQVKNNAGATVANVNSQGKLMLNGGTVITGSSFFTGSMHSNYRYRPAAGTYNVTTNDNVVIFNNAGASTAELPAVTADIDGVQYYIKNIGGGAVTITGASGASQNIDGQASLVCNQGDCAKLMAFKIPSGFEWAVLSFYDAS